MSQIGTATEIMGARDGHGTITSWEEKHTYIVLFDRSGSIPFAYEAATASGVPAMGARLGSTGLYAQDIEPKLISTDDNFSWNVVVTYKTLDPQQPQPKPDGEDKWQINISGNWVPRQEPTASSYDTGDSYGAPTKPVRNSSLEPFLGKNLTSYDLQINVTFTTDAPDFTNIIDCLNFANSEDITLTVAGVPLGFAPHTLYFAGASFDETITAGSDGTEVVRMSYVFLHRPLTWTDNIEDMGLNKLNDDGKLVPILDGNNQPITTPAFLDGLGDKLANDADVVTLPFEFILDTSFSGLLTGIS